MYFNSYLFILLFLPLAIAGYWLFQKKGHEKTAAIYLILMTLWFCGYGNPWNAVVFVVLVLIDYVLTKRVKGALAGNRKKGWLAFAVILNAGVLIAFKWYGRLPLGISFYTFQLIAYFADTYQGKCEDDTFLEYLQYMCFFPRFLQGPIVLREEFVPELRKKENKQINYQNMSKGLYGFALGLGKKVLLADTLAGVVNQGFADVSILNSMEALLVMVCYSLQLYFDFSGYCDMASGVACMLNLKLPVNFNSPYKAASISEFWKRWHITLTRFFTKYIYIPLGGSRKGTARTLLNIMIIFLVSGFWHGTNWTFIVWGALHGLLMVFERVTGYQKWKLPKGWKIFRTFVLSTFAWSIFRAESLGQARMLWKQLFQGGLGRITNNITDVFNNAIEIRMLIRTGIGPFLQKYPEIPVCIMVVLLLGACLFMRNTSEKTERIKMNIWKLVVTVGLLFWSVMSLSNITQFLYVNF